MVNKLHDIVKLVINNKPFIKIEPGIHGKAHAMRVLVFANQLCNLAGEYNKLDLASITVSALLHDCGRENNGYDPFHSVRSAKKANEFILYHRIDCNSDLVSECIIRHCPPPDYKDKIPSMESKIIGDSDKLDRFRFIDQKSPCNPKFFELKESKLLMDISARINGHIWRSFIDGFEYFDDY